MISFGGRSTTFSPFFRPETISMFRPSLMPVLISTFFGSAFGSACGVSTKNLGTHALLDLIVEGVPSPARKESSIDVDGASTAAFVFKTIADPFAGRINLFRVLKGAVSGDSTLVNSRAKGKERMGTLLELLQPVCRGLARQIRRGSRHLDERELERQPRIGALPHVLDGDRQQVAEAQHGRFSELVRLLAQPLANLFGDRQRFRYVPHVLHEQQVAEVLEEVGDETPEILALVGELLDEMKEPGGVAVDDQVADPEERFLLDRAEELENGLHSDRPVRPASDRLMGKLDARDFVRVVSAAPEGMVS